MSCCCRKKEGHSQQDRAVRTKKRAKLKLDLGIASLFLRYLFSEPPVRYTQQEQEEEEEDDDDDDEIRSTFRCGSSPVADVRSVNHKCLLDTLDGSIVIIVTNQHPRMPM